MENKELSKYDYIVVAPGFENNKHNSGLHWDTRLRIKAAAELYKNRLAEKIIVGGAQIREMDSSFATRMKDLLIKDGVPEEVIEEEEHTFDTPSQISWLKDHHSLFDGKRSAFVTDPEQAKHVGALMEGFDIKDFDILTTENILKNYGEKTNHHSRLFDKIHSSSYWTKWKVRELILTILAKTIDPKGVLLQKLTSGRKQS